MTELESLIVYRNEFTGDLPIAWSELNSLSWLALQNNQ
jgi:hypothetical protein